MRDKTEKYFEEIMSQVIWPSPSDDLHRKIIAQSYSRAENTILFFPVVKISSWVMIAFIVSFSVGMWATESPPMTEYEKIEAAYYGAPGYDFIEEVGY